MNIMQKLFGGNDQVAASTANAQVNPGNIPANNQSASATNNTTVPAASVDAMTTTNASPLDQFKDLWNTDPNAKAVVPESLFGNVTQANLQAAAKNNDFTKVITPEQIASINKGGVDAQNTMIQVMQAMAQKGFGDSAFTTTQIVEQALAKQQAAFEAKLPSLIKSQNVTDNLRTSNPIFTHPAAQPILDMFKNQALQKFPNATATEIQTMANSYLESFATAAQAPKLQAQQVAANNSAPDWSSFLE